MMTLLADCDAPIRWMAARQKGKHTTTGVVQARTPVLFEDILSSGRALRLREAVQTELYWEEGLWVCEFARLHIMGYGESEEKAIEAFFEDFFVAYDGLVQEEDSSLTVDARLAKRTLQHLVLAGVPACEIEPGLVGRI